MRNLAIHAINKHCYKLNIIYYTINHINIGMYIVKQPYKSRGRPTP
jgi:hypothetical protein